MGILKNKKAMTITAVAIAAVVGVGGMTLHANAALKVNSYAASTDTIVKIVEVNGNVVSDNTASIYSNINGKIASVNYKVGDYVKKGDTIISYDNDDIEQKIALAEYSMQESFGAYDNIIQSGGRSAGLYSEAKNTLSTLETQINDTQAAIDNLNRS
ncbi:MAG: biotin/lipoyl-binding protein, partial [Lachnospiraceae bacterium]|nr:biotin/lipoyl-binding protein [Lachnospiraceae bacterium]